MKRKYKITAAVLLAMAVLAAVACLDWYRTFSKENIVHQEEGVAYVNIYKSYEYDDVLQAITDSGMLLDSATFVRAARYMKLAENFKPGHYTFREGMDNKQIVRTISNGWQTPVKISFKGYIRHMDRFASIMSKQMEADSATFMSALLDNELMKKYGFENETFIGMFIPNTYEVYWTDTPEEFIERMHKEYLAFWNEERLAKAKAVGLSQKEVSTLASIVISETNYVPEMPDIAGVYMNRLHKGMLLQADPTVVFAVGEPGLRRVLSKHLKYDSPYNTYKYKGLPPGPITMPPISAIDAVLNYSRHNFLYFCAKPTFDGQHAFSANLAGHLHNARAYHKAFNAREKSKAAS